MPIVGLSERNRLARTGQFKIGERTERGLPRALDHFRIVGGAEAVEAVYGPKPKAVTVYLPLDLGAEVWDPYYKRYGASGLQCKGDGIVGQEVQADGSLKERDCAQRGCPFSQATVKNGKEQPPLCKPVGILAFQVVGVPGAGVYQIAVKGLSAIARVDSYLRALEAAAGGSLKGVPFVLKVEQTKGKDGFPTSRILVADAPETAAVLQGAPRYPRTAPIERVRGYAVLSERGELIATPEVRVGEDLKARAALAERLHGALEEGLIPAEHVQRYREMVAAVGNMSEAEAAEKLERLEAWLQNQGKAA